MQQMNPFVYTDAFPSWIANALQKYLSVGAFGFRVTAPDATHVQVTAGAGDQAAIIAVEGLWRWMEATVGPVAHPGGAAGIYPVFVTAKNNLINSTPQPFTDHTDYSFAVTIVAPGATPPLVAGTVDQYRHVADAHWDGTKITRVDQLVPGTPLHAGSHAGGSDPLSPADIGAAAFSLGGSGTRLAAAHVQGRIWTETDTQQNYLDVLAQWVPLGLMPVTSSSDGYALQDGQMLLATGGGSATQNVVLPGGRAGMLLGVKAGDNATGAAPIWVYIPTGPQRIKGRGLPSAGASGIALGEPGAYVILLYDGSNFHIVGGERNTGWVALHLAAGFAGWTSRYVPAYRLRADEVAMRGAVTWTNALAANTVIADSLPGPAVGFTALDVLALWTIPTSAPGFALTQVNADGTLRTPAGAGGGAGPFALDLSPVRYPIL